MDFKEISRIGLGTVQFGQDYGFTKELSQSEVNRILSVCLGEGINFLDTAREYGNSEAKIGEFLKENPASGLIISTKIVKMDSAICNGKDKVMNFITDSLHQSLENLGVEAIPLLQLHQTDDFVVNNPFFWECIEELKNKGLFQIFGVAVYNPEEALNLINQYSQHIDFLQLPYNIFDHRFERIFESLKEKDIGIISRSVFLRGMVQCSIEELPQELGGLAEKKEELNKLAESLAINPGDLALKFVLNNSYIQSSIIGVSSVDELQKNINVLKRMEAINLSQDNVTKCSVSNEFLIDPSQWSHV